MSKRGCQSQFHLVGLTWNHLYFPYLFLLFSNPLLSSLLISSIQTYQRTGGWSYYLLITCQKLRINSVIVLINLQMKAVLKNSIWTQLQTGFQGWPLDSRQRLCTISKSTEVMRKLLWTCGGAEALPIEAWSLSGFDLGQENKMRETCNHMYQLPFSLFTSSKLVRTTYNEKENEN